jgi:ribosome-associated protein
MIDSKQLAVLTRELADSKKADNIVIMDVRGLSNVTDFFVVASGTSHPHLRAILDEITEKLDLLHGLRPRAVDGQLPSSWVVLDYGEVIVHLMLEETRKKYDLESLWSDAPRVRPSRRKRIDIMTRS